MHDTIEKSLRRAFNLGQTYLQQADSESYSENKRSNQTLEKFEQLVKDTVARILPAASEADDDNAKTVLTDERISEIWSWSGSREAERTASTQQHAFAKAIERAVIAKLGQPAASEAGAVPALREALEVVATWPITGKPSENMDAHNMAMVARAALKAAPPAQPDNQHVRDILAELGLNQHAQPEKQAGQEIIYRWQALDFSGYFYGSNPPDNPRVRNLKVFYAQPDHAIDALREIAGTTNRTATPEQFARHLQRVAAEALAAPPAPSQQAVTAAEPSRREQDLAMAIRRIVSSARRNCEDGSNVLKLANEAWSLLVRLGLEGSPLRDAGIESDAPAAESAEPEWIDDPHDIEQGRIRNPKYVAPTFATAGARPCTCHPDDNPPTPCAQKYAYDECRAADAQGDVMYGPGGAKYRRIGDSNEWHQADAQEKRLTLNEQFDQSLPLSVPTVDAQGDERAALQEIANWPDGGNRYGQARIKEFARAALSRRPSASASVADTELPPLPPKETIDAHVDENGEAWPVEGYTEEAMLAYARAAVIAATRKD